MPHWHTPALQRSALIELHAVQVAVDGEPQARKLLCDISQVEGELQQPVQPLAALQTQAALVPLPVQTVPVGQTSPVEPHTQLPAVHRFAVVGLHVWHKPPCVAPQLLVSIVVWQLPCWSQQPLGHEVASQTQLPERQR